MAKKKIKPSDDPKTAPPQPVESEELTDKQVADLLVELVKTPFWKAINIYTAQRCALVNESFFSLDPFKEMTKMAQNQGIRMGLIDLGEFVKEEILRREQDNLALKTDPVDNLGLQGY